MEIKLIRAITKAVNFNSKQFINNSFRN